MKKTILMMFALIGILSVNCFAGTQKFLGDSVVGTEGLPVTVYSITTLSSANGIGQIFLKNGTDNMGDEFFRMNVPTSSPQTETFPKGRVFPNGLYFDKGNNVNYSVIDFE